MGPFEFIKLDWLNVGLFEFVNVGPFEFVKLNWVNVDRLAAPWVCLSLSNSDRLNAGLFEFEFVSNLTGYSAWATGSMWAPALWVMWALWAMWTETIPPPYRLGTGSAKKKN